MRRKAAADWINGPTDPTDRHVAKLPAAIALNLSRLRDELDHVFSIINSGPVTPVLSKANNFTPIEFGDKHFQSYTEGAVVFGNRLYGACLFSTNPPEWSRGGERNFTAGDRGISD